MKSIRTPQRVFFRQWPILAAATCAALVLLAGCKGGESPAISTPAMPTPVAAIPEHQAAPAAAAPAADTPVELKIAAIDGSMFDLAAHRGRWVVVNFWATWCHPCLAEMPALSQLDQRRADIDVVGLAYDEIEPDALVAFMKQHPVAYPIVRVDTDNPPKAFDVPAGLPTTYLLDRQGKMAKRFIGPVTPKEIEQAVDGAGKAGAMR